jgi:hypothetical protein
MRGLVLAVLLGLATSLPARAQTVTLDVCNSGAIDVDFFVSRAGAVSDSHIRPRTCQTVAKDGTVGIQEAYLGMAFVDSRGQWGAPRRFDNIRYMGIRQLLYSVDIAAGLQGKTLPRPETLTAASRNASVRHGNATVTLPLQLLFQSSMAGCRMVPTGRSTSSFIGGRETVTREYTDVCEDIIYTMTVAAYADSREASLGRLPRRWSSGPRTPSIWSFLRPVCQASTGSLRLPFSARIQPESQSLPTISCRVLSKIAGPMVTGVLLRSMRDPQLRAVPTGRRPARSPLLFRERVLDSPRQRGSVRVRHV